MVLSKPDPAHTASAYQHKDRMGLNSPTVPDRRVVGGCRTLSFSTTDSALERYMLRCHQRRAVNRFCSSSRERVFAKTLQQGGAN